MAEPILRLEDLNAAYGSAHVVQGVSCEVGRECVALMGRNGAGKTTLARAVMGLAPPQVAGLMQLGEVSLGGKSAVARSHLGLGYCPQGRRLFPSLSVAEHLSVPSRPARAAGVEPWTSERVFALFPSLAERRRAPGDRISGGERSMLAIGRALMTNPRCLILDEPTEGLAPAVIERVGGALRDLAAQGIAILLVEQSFRAVQAAADRVLFLSVGRIVDAMSASEFAARDDRIEAHLGVPTRK